MLSYSSAPGKRRTIFDGHLAGHRLRDVHTKNVSKRVVEQLYKGPMLTHVSRPRTRLNVSVGVGVSTFCTEGQAGK